MIFLGCTNDQVQAIHTVKAIVQETSALVEDGLSVKPDSVKIVGDLILNGKSIWQKNEKYIEPLMDSLSTADLSSREYYFKVFGKICEQADGVVGEEIGGYVLKYFESNPEEFIRNSALVSKDVFATMGHEAGLEVAMSNDENPEKVFARLVKEIKAKTKDLNESEQLKLDAFFQQIKEGLKSGE